MHSSLTLRLIGGAAIWLASALVAAGLGLSEVFDRQVTATYERQLVQQVDRLAAGLDWSPDGRLLLTAPPSDPSYRRPYSGRYWQASAASAATLRSESLWDQALELPAAGQTGEVRRHVLAGPNGQSLLVVERSVVLTGSSTPVRLATAVDRAEITAAGGEFNLLLSRALIMLGLGLMAAIVAQIAFGLWPLRRLRRDLALLRSRHQRRLAGNWPAEVRPLVDEINELLERDEAVLERTRRQAADLAHALKTPLAVLSNEAARGASEFHHEAAQQAEAMRRQIERHLARARAAGTSTQGTVIDVAATVRELMGALGKLNRNKPLQAEIRGTGRFAGDRQDLAEMLGNLLENAYDWAKTRVDVALSEADGRLRVEIDDDGPGMREEQRTRALERFGRLDESANGSGLGLAIVADIASMYRGELILGRSAHGGLKVILDLPAVAS